MVKVSVIVLNFNQYKLTIDCIESLLKQSFEDFERILIDNFSKDESYKKFMDKFENNPQIKIFQTNKNLGYTGGNNFGVTKSNGNYIAILNNDTEVEQDWLLWLVKGLESDDKVKIVGAEMHTVGNERVINYHNEMYTKSLVGYNTFFKVNKKNIDFVDVFSAGGCGFIYDRAVIDVPFPEEYFAYSEDTYLNWLIRLKGYKVLKATKSIGKHYHNSVRKNSKRKFNNYLFFLAERNLYLNFLIFYNYKNLIKIYPLMFIRNIMYNFYFPKRIFYNLKAHFWILFHLNYVKNKRKFIQQQRVISDEIIIKGLSYKLYDETRMPNRSKLLKFINKLSYYYCKLAKLKTIEMI